MEQRRHVRSSHLGWSRAFTGSHCALSCFPCSYLKAVDRVNEALISAYVTPGQVRAGVRATHTLWLVCPCTGAGLCPPTLTVAPTHASRHQVRFLLLHRSRSADAVRASFTEVHELYLKVLLNPFYKPQSPITAKGFDAKVKALAQRHL